MDGDERELVVISSGTGLANALRLQWERRGLTVRHLPEPALALDQTQLGDAALLVLDLDSTEATGLALCDRLAEKPAIPFIVLLPGPDPGLTTAVLDRGADDCLARPFNPQELSLRIQAILRRTGVMQAGLPDPANGAGQQTAEEREKLMAKTPKKEAMAIPGGVRETMRRKLSPMPKADPHGSGRKRTTSEVATARSPGVCPSHAPHARETGSSYPRRGPRWTTFAFVMLGMLITVSVVVASLGLGTGITTSEQASDEADLARTVAPLLERLQQNPADEAAMVALGNAYYDSGRWEEAIPWYEKALQAIPENTDVRTDLGTAYFYSGNVAKAKEQWSKVLEQGPNKVQTHYNMGLLYLHQSPSDTEAAAREWETVIKLAPGTEEASSAQEQLASLGKR